MSADVSESGDCGFAHLGKCIFLVVAGGYDLCFWSDSVRPDDAKEGDERRGI